MIIQKSLVFLTLISLTCTSVSALSMNQVHANDSSSKVIDNVILNQGQAMRIEFKSPLPEPIQQVSFKAEAIDTSNAFDASHVPITVEVFEKNKLIGSESFSSDLSGGFKNIQVDVNNTPKIDGNYKIEISFDTPEFNSGNTKIKVDLDTIKFNSGSVSMDLHGDIKKFLDTV